MKKGFTLLELMVVVGILAILAGALFATFGSSKDKALAIKCKTNLRNLATCCIGIAMKEDIRYDDSNGRYPQAGSTEHVPYDDTYVEYKGWISWLSEGVYRTPENDSSDEVDENGDEVVRYKEYATSHQANVPECSFLSDVETEYMYALTNGVMWKAIGANQDAYVCPFHKQANKNLGISAPHWSYVMNAKFGFDYDKGGDPAGIMAIRYIDLKRAEHILLFAEIPFTDPNLLKGVKASLPEPVISDTGDNRTDAILQYYHLGNDRKKWSGKEEFIGFNHRMEREVFAPVVFADGHVEDFRAPQDESYKDLTKWLCRGVDVIYHSGSYERADGESDEK